MRISIKSESIEERSMLRTLTSSSERIFPEFVTLLSWVVPRESNLVWIPETVPESESIESLIGERSTGFVVDTFIIVHEEVVLTDAPE